MPLQVMNFIWLDLNVRNSVVKYIDDKITKILASTPNSYKEFDQYNRLSSPVSIFVPSQDIAT